MVYNDLCLYPALTAAAAYGCVGAMRRKNKTSVNGHAYAILREAIWHAINLIGMDRDTDNKADIAECVRLTGM